MKLKTLLLCAVLVLSACTDEERAKRVLEEAGYTQVVITGYDWAACSEDDTYSTGVIAVGPTGKSVTGTVCCGLMKNCTIRID